MTLSAETLRTLEITETRYGKEVADACRRRLANNPELESRIYEVIDEILVPKESILQQRQFLGTACNS